MVKNEMLKAEGWRVTLVQGCPDFPLLPGATFLVGQKAGQKLHGVAWIDSTGCLQVGDATVAGAHLEATISVENRKWVLSGTRKKQRGKHRISGSVQCNHGTKPADGAGTWHAEGNGGG